MSDEVETEFKVGGELSANYIGLHESTGESYKSIADRVEAAGGHKALVGWLREQKDTHTAAAKAARKRGAVTAPAETPEVVAPPAAAKSRGRRTAS
jgi:hypothetical protein